MNNKNLGILYTILGSALIILFAGNLLIRFLGAVIGLIILNYGLQLLHIPSVKILVFEVIDSIKAQFKRK